MKAKVIKGKTKSGFEFQISEDIADDYELLESLVAVDKGEVGELFSVVERVLGSDQKKALVEHVRNESGKVKLSLMIEEMEDIFSNAGGKVKN